MFISEDEYLLAGTDLGYISAKRVEGVWGISLPPAEVNNPRFANAAAEYGYILEQLEANTIPVVIEPIRGNITNMASATRPNPLVLAAYLRRGAAS